MKLEFEVVSSDDYDDLVTVDFDPNTGSGKAFITGCEVNEEYDICDFKFSPSDYRKFKLYQTSGHVWMLKQTDVSFWRSKK